MLEQRHESGRVRFRTLPRRLHTCCFRRPIICCRPSAGFPPLATSNYCSGYDGSSESSSESSESRICRRRLLGRFRAGVGRTSGTAAARPSTRTFGGHHAWEASARSDSGHRTYRNTYEYVRTLVSTPKAPTKRSDPASFPFRSIGPLGGPTWPAHYRQP